MMIGWKKGPILGLMILAIWMGWIAVASAGVESAPAKKVLILYSYSSDIPVQSLFTRGLQNQLRQNAQIKTEYVYEYLDLARYSSNKSFWDELSRFLKNKYALNRPDLIITHFEPASKFMMEYGERTFPGIPAVLGLYESEGKPYPDPPHLYRDVVGFFGAKSAVQLILQLQPATKKIYVIAGDSERERKTIESFASVAAEFIKRIEFVYLNKLAFSEMVKAVSNAEDHSAILYFFLFKDAAGQDFIPGEALKKLHQAAKAPIYGSVSVFIGQGTIGGYMASQEILGKNVAEVAGDILQGRISMHAPVQKKVAAEYIFDWRELNRWGIDEALLPEGSRVEFRQMSVWDLYRWQIAGGGLLILLQAVLILQLLRNRKKRQRAEDKTQQLNTQLHDNLQVQQQLNATLEEEIMERQSAQELLGESEERYRAVIEQAPEVVLLVDPETGNIVDANVRFTEKFGYDLKRDGPISVYDITVDSSAHINSLFSSVNSGGSLPLQRRNVRHQKGYIIAVERSVTVVRYRNRKILAVTLFDVSQEVRREQELERDAKMATRVQSALLPIASPSEYLDIATIYQPFSYVGGDLFFMDWRYNGYLLRGFLIDAAGHGLGTALYAASLHVLLREVNERDLPLSEAVRWLNGRVGEYFDEATFAGALGFEFDLQTRQLRWVCAGITQFWQANRSRQGVVERPGMSLGIHKEELFETHAMDIDPDDLFYFMTDGLSDRILRRSNLPLADYKEMTRLLKDLSQTEDCRDDATAICIRVKTLPQSMVRRDGWPRIIRLNGYGDYQRLKGEVAKIIAEVVGTPHSLYEVAVNEALANAMECRDGLPRQHRARLRFNLVGDRFIVRVKSSRMGFAGNAALNRLRSHPEEMFSFGEDAAMGRGIPMMLSLAHHMTYNNDGTEVLLAWRLEARPGGRNS